MARTVKEIYDHIMAEKAAMTQLNGLQPAMDDEQTLLSDLTSSSKVAHWRLWAYITAFAIFAHEKLWDIFKADVEAIIGRFRPGTLRWYQEMAFAWQYGYELVWDATARKYQYATADDAAKLVKLCAVTEPGGVVRIKVANQSGSTITPLTSPQLAALQAYFNLVKYPGKLVCVSYSADLLKIIGTIKYNPLSDLAQVQTEVNQAIVAHLKALQFNGKFNITKLIDAVQAVAGVEDFTGIDIETKYGSLAYQPVTDEYQTFAGYAQIDPAHPLTSTLTFEPYV